MSKLKLCKVINEETKEVVIGAEEQQEIFIEDGFSFQEVDVSYDNRFYLKGYAPEEPAPTKEEQSEKRASAYQQEVDPITCHIQRLQDEEQTPEIEQEIEVLKQERSEKVEEIKERYPYPVGG